MSHQLSKSNEYVWTVLSKISIKLKDNFLSQIKKCCTSWKKRKVANAFFVSKFNNYSEK